MMDKIIPISIFPGGMINCFIIKGPEKHILVDTGVPDSEQKILRQLKKHHIRQEDIALIIVTHCHIDHFGSAGKLKEILKVPVLAHSLDVSAYRSGKATLDTMKPNKAQWYLFKLLIANQKAVPFEPDILMKGDMEYNLHEWGISGKVIHTPGHTPGSLSVILENGEAIIMDMLASGILLGGIMFKSRVKHPPFHDDLNELKKSFDKVLNEKGDLYYLGHGGPVDRAQIIKYYEELL